MVALADLRDLHAGAAYPGYVLEGCETALVLFAAGFLGRQDAYWIAEAGLWALCVDSDEDKLVEMSLLYPQNWAYSTADVFEAAADWRGFAQYDIVSLDPWTSQFDKCAAWIETWCSLARRAVILGTGATTRVDAPDGWQVTERRLRSSFDGGVYWTVLEPA